MKPIIAITIGDVNGVGPEVALKSLRLARRVCRPVLVGPASAWISGARALNIRAPFRLTQQIDIADATWASVPIISPGLERRIRVTPGMVSASAGRAAGRAIEVATSLAMSGGAAAVVTAPVSKASLHRAGYDVPGQTEMLQALCSAPAVAMMLVARGFRVAPATIHLPLSEVSREVTRALLTRRLDVLAGALRRDWGIRRPRIAVLGLNPHAGEGGDIGREEMTVIGPVIRATTGHRMIVEGPFPADAFFARGRHRGYDLVLAMYHDQGLIPLKMAAKGAGVNCTVGLPFVRTSPDHGTAFDIAGRGVADARSMKEAIQLAVRLSVNRSRARGGVRR